MKHIEIWSDETSEGSDNTSWIVSEEDGETSKTLSTHDDYDAALVAGQDAAKARGLKLVTQA